MSEYNPGLSGLTPRLGATVNWQDPQLHGLLSWFRLVDGGGAIIKDTSRFARHGTFVNPAWVNDGVVGASVPDFDGSTSQLDVSFFVPPIGTSPRTVTAWVWPDVSGLYGQVVSWGGTGNGEKITFGTNGASDKLWVTIAGSNYVCTTLTYTAAAWNFVAFTFSGSTLAGFTLFLNDLSESASGANSVNTTSANGLWIGYNKPDNSQYWDGRIRDLRIYDRALSYQEIQDIRMNPFRPFVARGLSNAVSLSEAADDEALSWLTFNQMWNPALVVGGSGSLTDVERQQFLHGLRDPIWAGAGLAAVAQQEAWGKQAGGSL